MPHRPVGTTLRSPAGAGRKSGETQLQARPSSLYFSFSARSKASARAGVHGPGSVCVSRIYPTRSSGLNGTSCCRPGGPRLVAPEPSACFLSAAVRHPLLFGSRPWAPGTSLGHGHPAVPSVHSGARGSSSSVATISACAWSPRPSRPSPLRKCCSLPDLLLGRGVLEGLQPRSIFCPPHPGCGWDHPQGNGGAAGRAATTRGLPGHERGRDLPDQIVSLSPQ